jgi:hypothetical protein
MEFLNQWTEFTVSNRTLFGIACLVLASYCRFRAVANFALWQAIFTPMPPHTTFSPAAFVRVGLLGCINGIIMNLVCAILLVAGFDQIFFQGRILAWLLG